MSESAITQLIHFLSDINAEVLRLEKEGDELINSEGQAAFEKKLTEKAELLASLGEKGWPFAEAIGGELGEEVAQKLERFSTSAQSALRIGSVFFMTALLYPEGHKPGEPNDLETYIEELREVA